MKTLPIGILHRHLRLDSAAGIVYWVVPSSNRVKAGDIALTVQKNGYGYLQLYGVRLRAHNVVWALTYNTWPKTNLDHKNRIRLENIVDNLRESTASLDSRNTARKRKPSSGYRGVYYNKSAGLYNARTTHDKKEISLGYFKVPLEAAKAYDAFVIQHIGNDYPTNASLGWL